MRYSRPGNAGERMRDGAAPTKNETASFGPSAVVNNTPDTVAPSVVSASVDASTITILLDDAPDGAAPDPTAFTVTIGGTTLTVTNVAMSGKTLTLTISPAVASSDNLTVVYSVAALNALHDIAGNPRAPFVRSQTGRQPSLRRPAGAGSAAPAPALVSESPADGSTVRSVSTFTLTATQSVAWTNMTVTGPDGTVTPLADGAGASASWALASKAEGLYVVRGTLTGGGGSEDILSHFTIWTPPATPSNGIAAPSVQKNAVPFAADELQSSDGDTIVSWPVGTFSDSVVVEIAPKLAGTVQSLPAGSTIVDVTAFLRSTHANVTELGAVIDIRFPNASPGARAVTSPTGSDWRDIAELPTFNLPDGQSDGWFRDSDGTVHVLTRHLTLYALVTQQVSTRLAMRIITARRLWLKGRPFIAVRMTLTAPARVTGNFVGPDGSIVRGQTIKTPTRRAGVTILRVPMHITKLGLYKLQMHAVGAGQSVNRTARIRFSANRPASPVWTDVRPLRVAVVQGVKLRPRSTGPRQRLRRPPRRRRGAF